MSYVQVNAADLSAVVFTMFQGEAQTTEQHRGKKCKFWFLLKTCCKKEEEFLSSNSQGNKKMERAGKGGGKMKAKRQR